MAVVEVISRTQTKRYPFSGTTFVLGRGPDCAAVITDDTLISRHHCQVVKHKGRYVLQDLKSRNGTRVLGKPIDAVKLIDSGVFQLGNTYVRFFFTQAAADAAEPGRHPGTTSAPSPKCLFFCFFCPCFFLLWLVLPFVRCYSFRLPFVLL